MKTTTKRIVLSLFIIISIAYIIPSVVYYYNNGTVRNLQYEMNEHFLFINTTNYKTIQVALSLGIVLSLTILYLFILKNHKDFFKEKKSALLFILIVQIIFLIGAPINSSDVYCYLGAGRLYEKYHQNPYYVSMSEYGEKLMKEGYSSSFDGDTVFENGFNNYWSETDISYGPIHTFVVSAITRVSGGNIDFAMFLIKCLFLFVNIMICVLLYKLFDNNAFYPLLYGLNPFVITTTVTNVHNDSLFILFILLAIYSIIKENKLIKSLIFLSLSVNIKFVSILFLPFIVLYACREKKITERIVYCVVFGAVFAEFVIVPWLPFYKDIHIFECILDQVGRDSNSIYCYIKNISDYNNVLKITSLMFFALYVMYCFKMLLEKEFTTNENMIILFYLLIFYLLFATTNLQYWYFIWFFPFLYFANREDVVVILTFLFISHITFTLFMLPASYDVPALIIFITTTVSCLCYKPIKYLKRIKIQNIQEKTSY